MDRMSLEPDESLVRVIVLPKILPNLEPYRRAARRYGKHPSMPQSEQDRIAALQRKRRLRIYARRAVCPKWQARLRAWERWRKAHPRIHVAPASKYPAWVGKERKAQKAAKEKE